MMIMMRYEFLLLRTWITQKPRIRPDTTPLDIFANIGARFGPPSPNCLLETISLTYGKLLNLVWLGLALVDKNTNSNVNTPRGLPLAEAAYLYKSSPTWLLSTSQLRSFVPSISTGLNAASKSCQPCSTEGSSPVAAEF
eukprot:SAG31_NODE_88_length_26714_cov_6.972046_15_plen_139_part_00